MDNIINQELIKENQDISRRYSEIKESHDKLKEALDQIALPALREYEQYEQGPIKNIAKIAMEKILELMKR